MSTPVPMANVRGTIADYLSALINVYVVLIIIWILLGLYLAFGGRLPYNRVSDAIVSFLRSVCDPYLALFRRFIPPIGSFDFSPIVAILVLTIGGGIIIGLIRG
ncbi:MAG: YggT family protein [Solirubrobacterales bacterium]